MKKKYSAFLLVGFLSFTYAFAESGVITATGLGKDAPEALAGILRQVVNKNFKDVSFMQASLQKEILPNVSNYVQSYRVQERSVNTNVYSADVDLDVIRALVSLTPKAMGEAGESVAFIAVKSIPLPNQDKKRSVSPNAVEVKPFLYISEMAKDWLTRRGFSILNIDEEEAKGLGISEDPYTPEVLRALALKHGARVLFSVVPRFEAVENEGSHSKEERVFLIANLMDVKSAQIISRANANFPVPKTRNEAFAVDLQKTIAEEGKDLFQDLFVGAGRKYLRKETGQDFSIVRILNPSKPILISAFRQILETQKGVQSVVEYRIRKGAIDFSVKPAKDLADWKKILANIQSEEILVNFAEEKELSGPDFTVAIQIEAKPKPEAVVPGSETEGQNGQKK